ncbi:MAG: hypothetical protein A2X86_13875 [Bdellovibrionales bacterium GWA2_49_15]|nr:MAG: hypothetical protein A2X86_13875 [Bdellovibrionales bacterium GWA2_49_15]HAZ13616.1 hypothetical protein [Bdellovibrionales bacterium]
MRSLTIKFQNNRRNIFWPYADSKQAAFDYGFSMIQNNGNTADYAFEGQHFAGLFGRMFTPQHYVTLTLGSHTLKDDHLENNSSEHKLVTQGLDYAYSRDLLQFNFSFNKDYMYSGLFLPAGVDETLVENKLTLMAKLKTENNLECSISAKHSFLSDGNQFSSLQTAVMGEYEISPISISAGGSLNYGQSRYVTSKYPSPWYILGAGAQVGANYFVTDYFVLSSGYSYTRFIDYLKVKGNEISKLIQVQFGDRNSLETTLSYVRMDSKSLGEQWYDNQVNFALNFSI